MTRLLLVRHGETDWNAARRLQGQADIPLSHTGIAQARRIAALVRRHGVHTVVCSDLQRARRTAEIIDAGPPLRTDERWREADLGDWTGVNVPDLLARDAAAYQRWRDGLATPPGGETMTQLRERIGAALAATAPGSGAGPVLVVTHGGAIRIVLALLLGLTAERLIGVEAGSLTVLDLRAAPRLITYNQTATAEETQA